MIRSLVVDFKFIYLFLIKILYVVRKEKYQNMISLGKCRIKILHDNNPTHNPQGQLLKKKICEIKIELRPGRPGGLSSLVHSHWSSNVEARL